MLVYGKADSNVWDTPLHDPATHKKTTNESSQTAKTTNDGTKTSSLTSSASEENFADQLSFMKEDFKKSLEQIAVDRKREAAE